MIKYGNGYSIPTQKQALQNRELFSKFSKDSISQVILMNF